LTLNHQRAINLIYFTFKWKYFNPNVGCGLPSNLKKETNETRITTNSEKEIKETKIPTNSENLTAKVGGRFEQI
jgi:hypothetical protein